MNLLVLYCLVTILIGYVVWFLVCFSERTFAVRDIFIPLITPLLLLFIVIRLIYKVLKYIAYRVEKKHINHKAEMEEQRQREGKFRVSKIERLRIDTDGNGVRTLVALNGCPLSCKYCLNPNTRSGDFDHISPNVLSHMLMADHLYFEASGGGVTFGGGEPMLQSGLIKEFREICPKLWTINIETCLNVPLERVQELADVIDYWHVDIKDLDQTIYQRYTDKDNSRVLENLKWMAENGLADKVCIRIPHIPGYNTDKNQLHSRERLEEMGFSNFDMFEYVTNVHDTRPSMETLGFYAW